MSKWRLAGWDRGKEREERKERVIGQVGSRSRNFGGPKPTAAVGPVCVFRPPKP